MSRNKVGGWHRLWIVISVLWVAVVGPFTFFMTFFSSSDWSLLSKIAVALALMVAASLVVAGLLVGGSPAFAQIPADLLVRAESGDAESQFTLEFMYAYAEGVPEGTEC